MGCGAITLDFHETIARCDEWFQIEVRTLPSAFFGWWAREGGLELSPSLIDAANAGYRKLRLAIHRHGHELPAERSILVIAESLGVHVDLDEVERGVQAVMRQAFASVEPIDGAVETICELHAAGVPLGIVSSAVYHPFLTWTLDAFGIGHCFGAVTTSASAGFYKSRPEIFWHTLGRLHANPEASVHIGDSLRFDVGGARQAGMQTVWLNVRKVASDGTPDLTVKTLNGASTEIVALLHGQSR